MDSSGNKKEISINTIIFKKKIFLMCKIQNVCRTNTTFTLIQKFDILLPNYILLTGQYST
jgi:hypothetical protein